MTFEDEVAAGEAEWLDSPGVGSPLIFLGQRCKLSKRADMAVLLKPNDQQVAVDRRGVEMLALALGGRVVWPEPQVTDHEFIEYMMNDGHDACALPECGLPESAHRSKP